MDASSKTSAALWATVAVFLLVLNGCFGPNRETGSPQSSNSAGGPFPPALYGNGEAYNGPRLEGFSIPLTMDAPFTSSALQRSITFCSFQSLYSWLVQIFGKDFMLESDGDTGGVSIFRDPGRAYHMGASQNWIVRINENGKPVRYKVEWYFEPGGSGKSPDPASEMFFVDIKSLDGRDVPGYSGPHLRLTLPTGLPRVVFSVYLHDPPSSPARSEVSSLVEEFPIAKLSLTPPRQNGIISLVDANLGLPTPLRANTEQFAECLLTVTQGVELKEVYLPASSQREESPKVDNVFTRRFLTRLDALRSERLPPGEWAKGARFMAERWNALEDAAEKIYEALRKETLDEEARQSWVEWCRLADSTSPLRFALGDCRELEIHLDSVAYRKTLERLESARSQSLRNFAAMIRQDQPYRRFRGFGTEVGDAGFHRGAKHLIVRLDTVSPEEYDLHFVHEMLHLLDDWLESSEYYFRFWHPEPGGTPLDSVVAGSWIMSGLDRGYLAEWRAWTVTFKLYLDGQKEGLWKSWPRVDEVLRHRKGADLKDFTLAYLDSRFPDPTEGPFESETLREKIRAIRESIRTGKTRPPMGRIGELLLDE